MSGSVETCSRNISIILSKAYTGSSTPFENASLLLKAEEFLAKLFTYKAVY